MAFTSSLAHSVMSPLVLKSVFSNNIKEFHGFTKFHLKKLLHWSCKGTVFQFNGQLFEQIDGISMGSPIAPLLADVCMNWVLNQIPSNITQPSILIRYVDDLFCTFSNRNQLDNYFQSISNIHPNITFSKELETNNHLAYLDISINTSNGKFETSVFRKKTNTGLYTKWNSLCPLKYKRNLVRCPLSRAYKICNTWPNIHNAFETITNMLLKNGYPLSFIQNQIRNFLNHKHQFNLDNNSNYQPCPYQRCIFFKLSDIGSTSLLVEKELRSCFQRKLQNKIKFVFIHNTFKRGNLFSHKDKQTTLRRSNVVYKLNCSCGGSYIGQTKRNLTSSSKEHHPGNKTGTQTDVTKHLLENPSHVINFNEPEILTTANHPRELLIKETLLIQQQLPSINVDESSTPLFVFNN